MSVVPLRPERLDDAFAAALGDERVQASIKRGKEEDRMLALGRLLLRVLPSALLRRLR